MEIKQCGGAHVAVEYPMHHRFKRSDPQPDKVKVVNMPQDLRLQIEWYYRGMKIDSNIRRETKFSGVFIDNTFLVDENNRLYEIRIKEQKDYWMREQTRLSKVICPNARHRDNDVQLEFIDGIAICPRCGKTSNKIN